MSLHSMFLSFSVPLYQLVFFELHDSITCNVLVTEAGDTSKSGKQLRHRSHVFILLLHKENIQIFTLQFIK